MLALPKLRIPSRTVLNELEVRCTEHVNVIRPERERFQRRIGLAEQVHAVEQRGQRRGIAHEVAIRTARGGVLALDLTPRDFEQVFVIESSTFVHPQFAPVFRNECRVEARGQRFGERGFSRGFTAEQADPLYE